MDIIEKRPSGTHRLVVSRRRLLQGTGFALATVVVTAQGLRQPVAFATARQAMTDIDIANYALTLEHLEAEFYKLVVGGGKLSGNALTILTAIRDHEIAHVDALIELITERGGTPVAKRNAYNFGDVSTQAAILQTAEALENTGVGAYTGAAALIADKTVILPAAASIEQVESRHYAAIRYLNGADGAPSAFGPNFTMEQVQMMIQPFLGN